ncbi:MAG TPA: hypothetical protein VHM70_08565 [Polyangiaceae bacterium]|jgi:hypothetical protein|nr:hypothetical protein [Polyangiaceae bacterium]
MKVVIAAHGHCFDGLCSAALFTRLLQRLESRQLSLQYRACGYAPGQPTPDEASLVGEQNAILDYRYTPSARVNWYFDHHRTAFKSSADREFFEQQRALGARYYYDADCSSCTKLIHQVAARELGVELGCEQLLEWADRVDSAAFATPEAAVSFSSPIKRLVSVVENHADDAFFARWIPELLARPLEEVASDKAISQLYTPIGERHDQFVEAVQSKAEQRGRVVYVDLTDKPFKLIGKFITYALFPQSVYSVMVVRVKNGFRISVGYNPWCGQSSALDISSICARYGGGGHSVVGGVSLPEGERSRAQMIATTIAQELDAG